MKKNRKSIFAHEYIVMIEKLIEARKQAGLTQKEVGEEIGWRQDYISKFESMQRRVDVIELAKLAKIYGKTINHFINHIK